MNEIEKKYLKRECRKDTDMIKAIHLLELGIELKASVTGAACYNVRDLVIFMVGDSDDSYGGGLIVWLGHGWERERRKLGRKFLLEVCKMYRG